MPYKILIVDDEISLRETLTYNFERQGYLVDAVGDGESAIKVARRNKPDLIILDIMLPGMDGFEVCRNLRRDMIVPILFLSARDDEYDRVVGFEIGGDDYILKPFSIRELIARVKAQFRTMQLIRGESIPEEIPNAGKSVENFGNLAILLHHREIQINGITMVMKPKEFDLLLFLTENLGRVITREKIIKKVWGWESTGDSRTIDVHVRWLREKIEVDPYNPVRIITVRGVGYRFDG